MCSKDYYTVASQLLYGTSNVATVWDLMTETKVASKYKEFTPDKIADVQFYPPATKMIFKDGTVTTSVAHEDDEFDPSIGMMVCIFKYIFKGTSYNCMLRKWIKNDENKKKEKEKAELEALRKEETRKRRAKKKAAKKLLKKMARKEEEIEIQKEAYIRAMKEVSVEKEKSGIE